MLGPARDPARPPTTCTMPPAHTALAVHKPARARTHTYTNTNAHSPPEPARLAKAAESRQRPAQATWEVSKKLRGMEGKTDSTARSPSATGHQERSSPRLPSPGYAQLSAASRVVRKVAPCTRCATAQFPALCRKCSFR